MRTGSLARMLAWALVGVGVGVVALAGASSGLPSTQAAWTDRVEASARVSAGTWETPQVPEPTFGCVEVLPDGTPRPGGSCEIVNVSFAQWSNGSDVVRDYRIDVRVGYWENRALVTVDLDTGAGGADWSWERAATVKAWSDFTPAPGFLCSSLPILQGTGPARSGTEHHVDVQVIEDLSSPKGSDRTCG